MKSQKRMSRREMLKISAGLAAVVGGSGIMSACAPATPAPAEPTAAPAEPTAAPAEPTAAPAEPTPTPQPTPAPKEKVKLHFMDVVLNDELTACAEDAVAQFTEATGIEVNIDKVAYNDFQTKLPVLYSSGSPPDVAWSEPIRNAEYVPKGWLTPLDDYFAASTVHKKEDLIPVAQQFCTYQGQFYEFPNAFAVRGGFYNKDILDQVGLALPETTAELKEACLAVHAADPDLFGYMWPMKTPDAWMWEGFAYIMLANREQVLDDEGKRCTLTTEGVEETMAFFVDIFDAGAAPEQGISATNQDMYPMFGDGKVAFMHTGFWVIPALLPKIGPENWGSFVVKGRTGQYGTPTSVAGHAIPAGSQHKDEAWQLLEWINKPEFSACFTTNPSCRPKSSPENAERFEDPAYDPFFLAAEEGGTWAMTPNPHFTEVNQIVLDESQAMILGKKTVKEAMGAACEQIDALLAT